MRDKDEREREPENEIERYRYVINVGEEKETKNVLEKKSSAMCRCVFARRRHLRTKQ